MLISKNAPYKEKYYFVWAGMLQRCYNPKHSAYSYYGKRGIKTCERWKKFTEFWKDMGETYKPGLTLDRIDNEGDYEPSNCKWSTMKEQIMNRSNTKRYEYKGQLKTVNDWAEEIGMKSGTLWFRIKRGWNIERALTTKTILKG